MSDNSVDVHNIENRQLRRIKREEPSHNRENFPQANKRAAFAVLSTQNVTRIQPFRAAKQAGTFEKIHHDETGLPAPFISNSVKESTTFTIHCDADAGPKKISTNSHHTLQIHPGVTGLHRQPLAPICPPEIFEDNKSENEESPMILDESVSQPEEDLDIKFSPEYESDIYSYLRHLETRHRPKPHYLRKQEDISASMRAILVDWLIEVGEEYKLETETLYLAINYIDRFLSCMSVLRGKLQLVGTACMFLAAKYEEIYPPDVNEFVYITDDTYTKKQVLRMEQLVLKALGFDLAVPTAYHFLKRFCKMANAGENVEYLSMYLCELSLLEAEPYLRYLPSLIAATALYFAQYLYGDPLWGEHLELQTGYKPQDFRECLHNLNRSLRSAPSCPQQAIREKYRSNKFLFVGDMNPPESLPMK